MNAYSSARHRDRPAVGDYDREARPRWRVIEIAVVVAGFIVWWPVGLALLLWKLWRNRQGYAEDMVTAARGLIEEKVMRKWPDVTRAWGSAGGAWGPGSRARTTAREWGFTGLRSSGNTAFDAWREGELARLEEERRKLETAEREFADYIESLRRAKDREEFERFMRDRNQQAEPRANA